MRYDKQHFRTIVESRRKNGKPWVSEEMKIKLRKKMSGKHYISPIRKRICLECDKEYEIIANRQKYCLGCRKKVRDRISKPYKKADTRKRRLLKKSAIECFTVKEWQQKLEATKGVCPKCNTFIGIDKLTLDHIIPISKAPIGFKYTINGVQPLCMVCNSKKRNG
jgi:5-methylcytosine-specific restriction endonuclease McrA